MFSIGVTLLVVIVTLGYFWVRRRFSYWEDHGFVQATPEFPFGNLKGVGYRVHMSTIITNLYNKYKVKAPMLGIYFFTTPSILVTDLEIIKHIMVKDFNYFHDRGMYFNAKDDPLSCHLFSIEGKEWKDMRAKLTPTFTSGKMKVMFGTVYNISKEMVEYLAKPNRPKEFEMKELLCQFTTDVIGNVAFGLDMNCIKDPDNMFRKMGKKTFQITPVKMLKMLFILSFQNLAKKLSMMLSDKEVSDFFLSSIRQTVEYREKNQVVRPDFLNLLIQIKNKGTINDNEESIGKITFDELAAQCFVFFLAGFETSSTTMTFALYELSLNPDVQDKLREEILANLEKHENIVTYESMIEMKYLQMVIDETLRKYPPVDNLIRKAATDYNVPNTNLVIPKDTQIFIPAYSIQNDETYYPNPKQFDPERFNDENKKDRHPMSYLPFGDGPRNCIGLRFGLMQAKVGLIQLISNFKFSPSAKTTIPMTFSISASLLCPSNDMWLNVEKL